MTPTLPPELVGVLVGAGLQVTGPQVRPTRPVRWTALDRQRRRWAVATITANQAPEARRWASTVAGINHRSLATVGDVLELPDGGVAVLVAADLGVDLALLLDAREPLDDAEAVTVLAAVADALAALHTAGIARGGLSPADVVLTQRGPVLDPGDPIAGSRSPAQDLDALAALGRQICRDGAHSAVAAACASGTSRDSASLADRIRAAGPSAQVRMPAPEALARQALLRIADSDPSQTRDGARPRSPRGDRRARGTHRASAAMRNRFRPFGAVLVVGALAVLLFATRAADEASAARTLRLERSGPARSETVRAETAEAAAVRLSTERIEAMAAGSVERLAALTEPGSPAARADAALNLEPVDVAEVSVTARHVIEDCPLKLVCVQVQHEVTFVGGATTSGRATLALRPGTWLVVEVLESDQP
jgi:eukaryotic-like serine/threonine-protein kinase